MTLTFDDGVLPSLPTHVGLVFTNAVTPLDLTIEAFDGGGASLGSVSHPGFTVPSPGLSTPNARFFGVTDLGGISRLEFSYIGLNTSMEFDHFQYGSMTPPEAVGAPATGGVGLAALAIGMTVLGAAAVRRRSFQHGT